MAFRVRLAVSSWLRCIGWQLVLLAVYYLAPRPTPVPPLLVPGRVGMPAVWGKRGCAPLYGLTEAESFRPTHCSPSAYFEGPFVWSTKPVCQSDDDVWLTDLNMAQVLGFFSKPALHFSGGVICAPIRVILSIRLVWDYILFIKRGTRNCRKMVVVCPTLFSHQGSRFSLLDTCILNAGLSAHSSATTTERINIYNIYLKNPLNYKTINPKRKTNS